MNKDVISISPEDDITDIIANIKSAKNKIIAIVPPQPAGILRSAVNIKLIAKTCEECEKVPVLVTSDPALMKLAASAHLPIADDLQSRPYIPTEEDLKSLEATPRKASEIAEDFVKPVNTEEDEEEDTEESDEKKKEKEKSDRKSDENSNKKDKKKGKSKLAEKLPWIEGKEKPIIIVLIALFVLAGFLVYAFVIAPEANIFITIKQNTGNQFSEYVTFTINQAEENAAAGVFLLEEVSDSTESEVVFQATGQKDIGEKATGELEVTAYFDYNEDAGKQVIAKGSEFTLADKKYVSTEDKTIFWDSEESICENVDESLSAIEQGKVWKKNGCAISTKVKIEAAEPGEKYNIKDYSVNWSSDFTVQPVVKVIVVSNDSEISGGTTEIINVVQQSDVDAAKEKLNTDVNTDGREKLEAKISDMSLPLETTFSTETSDIKVAPEIGTEVKDGQTAKITSVTTYKMYTIDMVRIEEFINSKVTISEDNEIYSIGEPYVERFNQYEKGYSGKLKTTFKVGPKISEESIFEKIAGKKIGDAKSQLLMISGIDKDSLSIETSMLINNIPTDKERVHITIKREE